MKNYKNVCGNKNKVWFEIKPNEAEMFLKWAKDLGCKWSNGNEIHPDKHVDYLHFSIRNDGTLAYVNMMVWFSNDNVEKYVFSEYIKGINVSPKSKMINVKINKGE